MAYRAVLSLTAILFAWGESSAENLVSGPQVGEKVSGRFTALIRNGEYAGMTRCPVELPGYDLTALIFVSDASDPLIALVRKIDKQLAEAARGKVKRGVFLILTSTDPAVQRRLVEVKLKHVVLCTGPDKGLQKYEIAEQAAQTAVIYTKGVVKANHAFRTGELDAGWSAVILEALGMTK